MLTYPRISIRSRTLSFLNRLLAVLWTAMCCASSRLWLKAPIEERDKDGTRRMSGGKGKQMRHAPGRSCKPFARQYLHEPVPEILAFVRLR